MHNLWFGVLTVLIEITLQQKLLVLCFRKKKLIPSENHILQMRQSPVFAVYSQEQGEKAECKTGLSSSPKGSSQVHKLRNFT